MRISVHKKNVLPDSQQAVREFKIKEEYTIGANTRFAPTKDFSTSVGVNLVFTQYFRTPYQDSRLAVLKALNPIRAFTRIRGLN